MALDARILDTGLPTRVLGQTKIDLATPVNMYTSLQANKRANRADARQQSLADLTLTQDERRQKRQVEFGEIMKSSLNPNGTINGEMAIQNLNQGGFYDEAVKVQDRMVKVAQTKQDEESRMSLELANISDAVISSKNPVDAFMLAREEAVKKGLPVSEGLLNYFPTDEEIADGRLDPRVVTELQFLSEKAVRPKGPMSFEEKMELMRSRYNEKKILEQTKSDVKVDQPLTEAEKSRERIAKQKVGIAGKKLDIEEAKEGREVEKWEEKKKDFALNHKKLKNKNKNAIAKFGRFSRKARMIANSPDLKYITGGGRFSPSGKEIPLIATKGKDLQAELDNLISLGAINTMIQLKSESKTGATGFGALSEKELKILQDALGSMENDQVSVNQKKKILLEVADIVDKYQDAIEDFETEFEVEEKTDEQMLDEELEGLF